MKNLILICLSLLFSAELLAANPIVRIETNLGNMDVELNSQKAPKTVENFLRYSKENYFEGTIFHRVIKNFMIQGGGFTANYQKKPIHDSIINEADNGLKNDFGTIAMARTSDPHSASSQFFINTKNNDFLNFKSKTARGWGYTVFGKVIKGVDTIKKIEASKTSSGGPFRSDAPVQQVIIKSIKLISEK